MSNHVFNLRLSADHNPEDNTVTRMSVENLVDGKWQPLGLCETSPGFLIFVYSIFACHHRFLRVSSKERDLVLKSSNGTIHLVTDDDWRLGKIETSFSVTLVSGSPNDEDRDYIIEKMMHCPVSRNLPVSIDAKTDLLFD